MVNMNNSDILKTDVLFYENFISSEYANTLFNRLINIDWEDKRITSSGEVITIKRKMAYMSEDGANYSYDNLTLSGMKWDEEILTLKQKVEEKLHKQVLLKMYQDFNSVLLNLYSDGRDEIRWHSDSEKILGNKPIIATVSLGATRTFKMRKKNTEEKQDVDYKMLNGSLLIMLENCQENWYHAVLKEKEIKESRISLTFRKVMS